ncbi:flagellar basal body rod protein FlgB [Candidatus Contubernalis alkaliaceticus]|uniref:flagellar basal body rod protein FlgB n=1 Tax=Candidatus Contubernalis alkaliaceticus TaxID=338645 RepID=UPI001F4C3D18|nr:flagellar basal body rod protein FlgB [Candidatus Contubernalis alkalaceticus]UNC91740.1 flagellar basal body rod protein FlgB [Candidatus Contubernalis alkalaceticus]
MANSIFSGDVLTLLQKGLGAASLSQKVSANNIANVNTPYFKRSQVVFQDHLAQAYKKAGAGLAVTRPGHMGGGASNTKDVNPRVEKDTATRMRSDGNNVDVDREMAELTMNQLYYNALSQSIDGKLGMLRYVINDGRR